MQQAREEAERTSRDEVLRQSPAEQQQPAGEPTTPTSPSPLAFVASGASPQDERPPAADSGPLSPLASAAVSPLMVPSCALPPPATAAPTTPVPRSPEAVSCFEQTEALGFDKDSTPRWGEAHA